MDELENTISDSLLKEWIDFFEIEPWGAETDFIRSGIVASTIVNASANKRKGSKPASPSDFIPDFGGLRRQAEKASGLNPARIKAEILSAFGDRIKEKADGGPS